MNAADYGWLVLLTPLLGLGFNIAVGASVSRRVVAWAASLSILAGFVLSLLAFFDLLSRDDSAARHRVHGLDTGCRRAASRST